MLRVNEEIFKEKDGIRVALENIGEGWFGDYDETNPDDEELLRFTVYTKLENSEYWEQVDDASYCTAIPASSDKEYLEKILNILFNEFYEVLHNNPLNSVKKLGERLSWIN